MSYDIYLCCLCLDPIWFPGGEVQHVGTGWYCPHEGKPRRAGTRVPFATQRSLTPEQLRKSVKQATVLYRAWRRDHGDREIMHFLAKHLRQGKAEVVRKFLGYLAKEETAERRRTCVDDLVRTPGWHAFVSKRTARPAVVTHRPSLHQ